jgi:hypothetical protein
MYNTGIMQIIIYETIDSHKNSNAKSQFIATVPMIVLVYGSLAEKRGCLVSAPNSSQPPDI